MKKLPQIFLLMILIAMRNPLFGETDFSPSFLADSKPIMKSQKNDKTLYIRNADQITYSQEKDPAGYQRAVLYGNVDILYADKEIFADEMVIKFLNEEPKEIYASGNIIIETPESILIGEKLFFYPDTGKGIVYQAETYNKPYFIRGDYFKFLEEKKLIAKDMTFSTCDMLPPHFAIGAAKGWIYKDDKDMFLGFQIIAGRDPIFYFPFMYRSYYGTGLITALGRETGAGWFVNNTYKTQGEGYNFKLMLDHYQKIGEYVGIEYKRTDIGTLDTKLALIYDKHVKYVGGEFLNFFEEVDGQGPVSGRSIRYKADVSYEKQILDGNNFLGLSTTVKGSVFEQTDPSIQSQFESHRMETFDAQKILFPEISPTSMAGSFGTGGGQGRKLNFSVQNSFHGFTLNVKGDWNYTMNKTDDPEDAQNPYRPEFYKNYKSSVIFPSVSLSKTLELFDPMKWILPDSTSESDFQITWPYSLSHSSSYTETKNYSLEELTSDNIDQTLQFSLNFPFTLKYGVFSFKVPFHVSNNDTFQNNKSYSEGEVLASHIKTQDYKIDASYPPAIEIGGDSHSISSSLSLSRSFQYHEQNTQGGSLTPEQTQSDQINTYYYQSSTIGNNTLIRIFQNYEYLDSTVQGTITYSESEKYGDELPESQQVNTKRYSYLLKMGTMKSSATLTTGTNLSDNVSEANRKEPLNIKMDSSIIPYLTLSDTYIYDRYLEKSSSNQFSISSDITEKIEFTDNFWLNSFKFTFNWSKNYANFRNDYLDYSFSIDFNYTHLWQFSLAFSGKNDRLYYYTEDAPVGEKRDIWNDLYRSLKIWSIKDREETFFKMKSFGLNIKHDLHKWSAEFRSSFTPKLDPSGAFYFESQFIFQLTLKDIPSLTPPKIEKIFGARN